MAACKTLDLSVPLDGIQADELVFLPLFPSLLTGVGIRGEAETLAYDELAERLALEIGGLGASFELQPVTGRLEFSVSASGVGCRSRFPPLPAHPGL